MTCPSFPQRSSSAIHDPSLSVSCSRVQSMRDSSCLLPEGRRPMCSYCCWSYVQSVFADVLLVLTFLSSFRWFLFSCTVIHFSTWTALYFPFLFLVPLVSFMSLVVWTLFRFIKYTSGITVVLWRPWLSRDVPLSKCHRNAKLHIKLKP